MRSQHAADAAERLRQRAARADHLAAACELGAAGEELVAELLAPLAAIGYRQFDDRRLPGRESNLDHLVVGPAGVFVIAAKNWGGQIRIDDDVLRISGRRRSDQVDAVRSDAHAVADVLSAHLSGEARTVQSVMCFVGEARVGIPTMVDGVHLVDGDSIVDFFARMDVSMQPGEVSAVASVIADNLAPRIAEAAEVELVAVRESDEAHPPPEPIVYLTAWHGRGKHWLYVKDELGNDGGYLDLKSGQVVESTEAARAVLQQLLPHYINGGDGAELSAENRGAVRRFLSSVFSSSATSGPEVSMVAGQLWRNYGLRRLYVDRLEPGAQRTPLGWYDLDDGIATATTAEFEPIVRYCGRQYLSIHPQTRRPAPPVETDLFHEAG